MVNFKYILKILNKIYVGGIVFVLSFSMLLLGCVSNRDFDEPEVRCSNELEPNASFADVKSLYIDETILIQEDLVIEGYIISSDAAGNFFSVLHLQDALVDPTEGFQIEIDLRDSHLFYDLGQKVLVKLKGLYLGKASGVYKLGGVFNSFGNLSVGRLPSNTVFEHVLISCATKENLEPLNTTVQELNEMSVNTLIKIDNMEISANELGFTFAVAREETERLLIDCDDNELVLLNSGFSDFQDTQLPELRGTITGVITRDNNAYQLIIRNLEDIQFNMERCEDVIDEFTSQNIFFSELADPENNTGARFVEIYNAANEPLSLKGWTLLRYTNASLEVSSSLDLSNFTIGAQRTLVVAPNAQEFETVYGFAPDINAGTNSPADSNGDDNLQLVDPFGTVIDVFGVVGEDGSGTNHEFEDGRAIRNINISMGNSTYTFSEWTVYNDTGGEGTTNIPQNAPEDFTPGVR